MSDLFQFKIGSYNLFKCESLSFESYDEEFVKIVNDISDINFIIPFFTLEKVEKLLCDGVTLFVYVVNGIAEGVVLGCKGSSFIRGIRYSLCLGNNDVYCFWVQVSSSMQKKGVFSKIFNIFRCYYSGSKIYSLVHSRNFVMSHIMYKNKAVLVCTIYYFLLSFVFFHIVKSDKFFNFYISIAPQNHCLVRVI